MGRVAISAGIAATLVATAVAPGAVSDVRIHRLHVPPPPTGEETGPTAPPVPGKPSPTDPSAPPGTSPPVAPPAPGAPPQSPPASPGLTCTTDSGPSADVTGTLSDYAIAAVPSTVAATPSLRIRGVYPAGGADQHNLSLRDSHGTLLCGTSNLVAGQAQTFVVTNLPPGTYELYCTIHVAFGMKTAFSVN
jgi:plastocyanin